MGQRFYTAAEVEPLHRRIAELEEELAAYKAADRADDYLAYVADVMKALGVTANQAAILLAMHRSHPSPMSRDALADVTSLPHPGVMLEGDERCIKAIDVLVCHTRKRLGREAIENVRGLGYRLSAVGRELVRGALEPRKAA